jgi:predicted acetyltransferase
LGKHISRIIQNLNVDFEMIVKPADPEEYDEIEDVVKAAFKQPDLELGLVKTITNSDPNFHKGDLRVVRENGKAVSMMLIIRKTLRIGEALVSGAIVAPVATHPNHSGRGYCSAIMRNAVEYMKNEGFDITILWGHPWLYTHYGYSPGMFSTKLVIAANSLNHTEEQRRIVRPFVEADLEQVTRIYNSNTSRTSCAEVRSPNIWEWTVKDTVKFEVITNQAGNVSGYIVFGTDWGRQSVLEMGTMDDETSGVILNRILEEAVRKDLKEIPCPVSPDHPFTRYAFWHDAEIRINSGRGAGMARVLNLNAILEKMLKEFERRLYSSELHYIDHSLTIATEESSAVLDIRGNNITLITDKEGEYRIDLPLYCLNPLITGYKGIHEILKDPRVKLKGGEAATRLLEVLFPTGHPRGGVFPLVWE